MPFYVWPLVRFPFYRFNRWIFLVDVVKQNSALASIISMDITRYGAQVISGVGFLGAGIIVFRERKVSGLTTAVMM